MYPRHFERYFKKNFNLEIYSRSGDRIKEGILKAKNGSFSCKISEFIPIFSQDEYVANFALQWGAFPLTQLDSAGSHTQTSQRFYSATGWHQSELAGKSVLEIGSGAGRFTEVIAKTGCNLVTFDLSDAIHTNYKTNQRENICFLQGSVYEIPLETGTFDYVFCYGVVQHTPDPKLAVERVVSMLRSNGLGSIDFYRKWALPNVWSTPKRVWRPITTRIPPKFLLQIIKIYMPIWLPVDTAIRSIPFFGPRILAIVPVPCWNYIHSNFSYHQRLEWAIMDTFDALGARFDTPFTKAEVARMFSGLDVKNLSLSYGSNGIIANFQKK